MILQFEQLNSMFGRRAWRGEKRRMGGDQNERDDSIFRLSYPSVKHSQKDKP